MFVVQFLKVCCYIVSVLKKAQGDFGCRHEREGMEDQVTILWYHLRISATKTNLV